MSITRVTGPFVDGTSYNSLTGYGALGDGLKNDAAAIALYEIERLEHPDRAVRIGSNEIYRIGTNTTLAGKYVVEPGGGFTVDAGKTLTITGEVMRASLCDYEVFFGDGTVVGTLCDIAFFRARERPTLRGYFGVDPSNEEQAMERMQDAARSGMNVFIDPGTYKIDETVGLRFDEDPTVFQGAGSSLVTFTSLTTGDTGDESSALALFRLLVGGCGLSGCRIEGDDTVGTDEWPYIGSLVTMGGTALTGRQDFYTLQDVHGIGGTNCFNFGRADKVTIRDCYGERPYNHVLSSTAGQVDVIVDGLKGYQSGQEFIAFGANDNTDATGAQTNRVLIQNFIANECGINGSGGLGPTEAIDLFINSATNLTIADGHIYNCGFGGIEIKRHDITGLPNQYENLIIDNVNFHSNIAASMINLHWSGSGSVGGDIEETMKNFVFRNLTARYTDDISPGIGGVINITSTKGIELQNITISGAVGTGIRFVEPDNAGIGSIAKRIRVDGLTIGDEATCGIWIESDYAVDLELANLNIDALTQTISIQDDACYDRVHIRDSLLRTAGATVVQNRGVIKEFTFKGVRLEGGAYGIYNSELTTTAAAADLPDVSNCVTAGGLVKVTFASPHGLADDDAIYIAGVSGTTEANGPWLVDVVDATHVTLRDSTFSDNYVSGGTARFATKLICDDVQFKLVDAGAAIRSEQNMVAVTNPNCAMRLPNTSRSFLNVSLGSPRYYGSAFRGYRGAIPTAAGAPGDVFLQHTPASGATPGWVCTTAGDEDAAVWKAMASLA